MWVKCLDGSLVNAVRFCVTKKESNRGKDVVYDIEAIVGNYQVGVASGLTKGLAEDLMSDIEVGILHGAVLVDLYKRESFEQTPGGAAKIVNKEDPDPLGRDDDGSQFYAEHGYRDPRKKGQ